MAKISKVGEMVAVTGNTYPVKEQLKKLGAKWDAESKCWMVPFHSAAQAKAIVEAAPKQKYVGKLRRSFGSYDRGRRTGCSCGSIEGVPQESDCQSCRFENFDQ
jgi:hypothetical protein